MGQVLLRHEDGTAYQFPIRQKLAAFSAVELIQSRLELPAAAVRSRDPDTHEPVWVVRLLPVARSVAKDEMMTAVEICDMAGRG